MVKGGKVKNPCKICFQTVTAKNGLRCLGACQKWAHFKCLNYTPGKIQDIKAGLVKVACPCPDCHGHPEENCKQYLCGKKKCPAKSLKCEASTCTKNNPYGSTQTEIKTNHCPADCPLMSSISKNTEDIRPDLIKSQPKKCPPQSMPIDQLSQNYPLQPPLPCQSQSSIVEPCPPQSLPTKLIPSPLQPGPLIPPHPCRNTLPPPNLIMQPQSSPCPGSGHSNESIQRIPCSQTPQQLGKPPCPIGPQLSRPHNSLITEPEPNDCWFANKRSESSRCYSPQDPTLKKCGNLPPLDANDTNHKKCCELSSPYTNNTQGKRNCNHLQLSTHGKQCKECNKVPLAICPGHNGQVMIEKDDTIKSKSCCEVLQHTQYSKGDKLSCTSISDSDVRVCTARSKLSCKMEQLCTTIGEFSDQFKELMCKMMAALDNCR